MFCFFNCHSAAFVVYRLKEEVYRLSFNRICLLFKVGRKMFIVCRLFVYRLSLEGRCLSFIVGRKMHIVYH